MKGPLTAGSILARYPFDREIPADRAAAAVLAVLRDGAEDVEVLLIERAENDDDPASGQIGLPGGHVEPTERSLDQTALRECEEEIGIGPRQLKGAPRFVLMGRALSSRMRVAVFAAELVEGSPEPTARDPEEVASVFWLPLHALSEVALAERKTSQGVRAVPAVRSGDRVVWGFTLRVLRVLFGLEPAEPLGHSFPDG